jgi:hypothetical protein
MYERVIAYVKELDISKFLDEHQDWQLVTVFKSEADPIRFVVILQRRKGGIVKA